MSFSAITKKAMKVIAAEQAGFPVVDSVITADSPAVINAMRLRVEASVASAEADNIRRAWQRASYAERVSRARAEISPEAREYWLGKLAADKEAWRLWDAARSASRRAEQLAGEAESDALKSEILRLRSRNENEVLKDEIYLLRAKVAQLKVALAKEEASVATLLAGSLE